MRYEFICDDCQSVREFQKPMSEGPPKKVLCTKCTAQAGGKKIFMRHVLGGNFILKGDGWAGKDLKKRQYDNDLANEQTEAMLEEDKRNQRIVDEVMEVRRKGTKATDQLKKDNPQKFKDYESAMDQGYRAEGKSYKAKSKDFKKVNES